MKALRSPTGVLVNTCLARLLLSPLAEIQTRPNVSFCPSSLKRGPEDILTASASLVTSAPYWPKYSEGHEQITFRAKGSTVDKDVSVQLCCQCSTDSVDRTIAKRASSISSTTSFWLEVPLGRNGRLTRSRSDQEYVDSKSHTVLYRMNPMNDDLACRRRLEVELPNNRKTTLTYVSVLRRQLGVRCCTQ